MSAIPVDAVMVAAAGITGAGSAYKAFGLRRERHDPATHAVVLALACLAASSLLFTPSLYAFFDARLRVTNLSELVGHSFVLVAGWNGQRLLLHLSGPASPRRIWWRGAVAATAVVGLAVFFTSAPRPTETTNFITLATGQWANNCYWLVLTGCLLFQLADIGRLAWRCARLAPKEWIGIGLTAVAVGCGVGMAAFTSPLVYVGFRLDASNPPQLLDAIAHGLCVTSMSLVALGAVLPAWSRKLAADPYALVRAYRANRELRQLWSALRDAVPDIALKQRARNAEFRLYRRVIEIRDGI
ncbi:MAG: MAB_1171c family putative transporter, partial [Acidothermaceae bacterium]